MRATKVRLLAAIALAVVLGVPLPAPARADDPVPPITMLDWLHPNVPIWQTFGFRAVEGSAPVDHFECRLDEEPWVVCASPWDPELTGGTHSISVHAVDVNGLADPTPEDATFFVDIEGPVPTLVINGGAATAGRATVRLDVGGDVDTSTMVLIANSTVLDEDGRLANAWSNQLQGLANRHWGWTLDEQYGGSAGPGVHTVCIQAVDGFSNWGPAACDTITLDPTDAPGVRIRLAASENPAPIGDRAVVLAFAEATDGAPIVDGTLSLGVDAPGGGRTSMTDGASAERTGVFVDASGLPPGEYRMMAAFVGSSELADEIVYQDLRVGPAISMAPPYASFEWPSPYPYWDRPAPFTLGITSRYGSAVSFQCRIDEEVWAPCAGSLAVPLLADGTHTAEIRGTDRAGRVQPVPELFTWRVGVPGNGSFWFDTTRPATNLPVVDLRFEPPPGALAVRISAARAVGADGRLAQAVELVPPPRLSPSTSWSLVDPAYGGGAGDGRKLVWVQWQLADGTWPAPEVGATVLDRVPPQLALVIERGSPFVDDDEVLVLAKTDGDATILLTDDPAEAAAALGSVEHSDGLAFLAWPVDDVRPGTVATKTLYAAAWDAAGNKSTVAEASVVIDRTSPETRLRPLGFVVGGRVSATSVKVRVGASAADSGSGVASTVVQELRPSSTSTIAKASASSIRVDRRLPFAAPRAYRSRASDRLGHVGSWATGTWARPVLREVGSAAITWSGRWRNVASSTALGRTLRRSAAAGATATLRFTGRAVAVVAPRGPGLGRADVLVDGVRVATIDLQAGSGTSRVVVFAKAWPAPGSHRLTVRVRGTAGRPTVPLDAFVVLP
jgi:hypothetical protein